MAYPSGVCMPHLMNDHLQARLVPSADRDCEPANNLGTLGMGSHGQRESKMLALRQYDAAEGPVSHRARHSAVMLGFDILMLKSTTTKAISWIREAAQFCFVAYVRLWRVTDHRHDAGVRR